MSINSFTGSYRFLSNFYHSPIVVDGIKYKTVEHAFQAMKATNTKDAKMIADASTPKEAKRLGRSIKMRSNWNPIRLDVMLRLLRLKFKNPTLRKALLDTGSRELIEGNDWGDKFWGKVGNEGKNHLGQLLMQVRNEVRQVELNV